MTENENIIKLSKPYNFEGTEHIEIDLSNLENVTTADLEFCDSRVSAIMPEMTLNYALLLASRVTGKPIEFFKKLPGREGLKIKRLIMSFLNAAE